MILKQGFQTFFASRSPLSGIFQFSCASNVSLLTASLTTPKLDKENIQFLLQANSNK